MIRTLAAGALLVVGIAMLVMQNQKLRTERNLIADRLEAIGGAREIENVIRQLDDCGLFGVLTDGLRSTDGGAVLGCAEDAASPETGNGRLHHPE